MKTILRFSSLILICLSVACGPTANLKSIDPAPGPAAWIDAPLNDTSLPLAEYEVVSHASDPAGISSFELSVNGQVIHTDKVGVDQAGQPLAHIQQAWMPPAPGVYLLSVRAANSNGSYGPYAFAHVTVGDVPTETAVPSRTATLTPTITPTPTLTFTPTPSVTTVTGLQNTNCRYGPGGSFEVSGTLFQGKSVIVEAINPERTWVLVHHPNFDTSNCWVSIPLVQITGDLNGLPIDNGPARPKPTDSGRSNSGVPSSTELAPTSVPLVTAPPR